MLVDMSAVAQCIVVSSAAFLPRLPITTLVRTERRLSVRIRGYLPPHNFTVRQTTPKPWKELERIPTPSSTNIQANIRLGQLNRYQA
jgi:hypothetical protein